MSARLELYCTLRETGVPAEKARAVVDALEAVRHEVATGATHPTPTLVLSRDQQLQQLQDELLELKLQHLWMGIQNRVILGKGAV